MAIIVYENSRANLCTHFGSRLCKVHSSTRTSTQASYLEQSRFNAWIRKSPCVSYLQATSNRETSSRMGTLSCINWLMELVHTYLQVLKILKESEHTFINGLKFCYTAAMNYRMLHITQKGKQKNKTLRWMVESEHEIRVPCTLHSMWYIRVHVKYVCSHAGY